MNANDLRAIEARFGEVQTNVERRKVSAHDRRTPEQIKAGGMQGSDRMGLHGYAETYAEFLPESLEPGTSVVEMGILRGHGLALLCHLYPHAEVYGLDVDLSHFRDHEAVLRGRGAFKRSQPALIEFDELSPNSWRSLSSVIPRHSVAVWIDDALHDNDAIVSSALSARKFMRPNGLYFIEDNDRVDLSRYLPGSTIHRRGRLTVIQS